MSTDPNRFDKLIEQISETNRKFLLIPDGSGIKYAKARLKQSMDDRDQYLQLIDIFKVENDKKECAKIQKELKPIENEIRILSKDIQAAERIFNS